MRVMDIGDPSKVDRLVRFLLVSHTKKRTTSFTSPLNRNGDRNHAQPITRPSGNLVISHFHCDSRRTSAHYEAESRGPAHPCRARRRRMVNGTIEPCSADEIAPPVSRCERRVI